MDFQCYLAMTAAEICGCEALPRHSAWMACHYACYGNGLSNLPRQLPGSALLIINDRTPPMGHDATVILRQLEALMQKQRLEGVLLDFQRIGYAENQAVASTLSEALPCPVCVSEAYAEGLEGPVFAACPLPHEALEAKLQKWRSREIWLELAPDSEQAVITREGASFEALEGLCLSEPVFTDTKLHCKYRTQVQQDRIVVQLQRDAEALKALRRDAVDLGIRTFVGLYQQLGNTFA